MPVKVNDEPTMQTMSTTIEHTREPIHRPKQAELQIDENPYKNKTAKPVHPIKPKGLKASGSSQVMLPAINNGNRQDQSWSVEIPKRNQSSELAVSVY